MPRRMSCWLECGMQIATRKAVWREILERHTILQHQAEVLLRLADGQQVQALILPKGPLGSWRLSIRDQELVKLGYVKIVPTDPSHTLCLTMEGWAVGQQLLAEAEDEAGLHK